MGIMKFIGVFKSIFSFIGDLFKAGGTAAGGELTEQAGKTLENMGDAIKRKVDGEETSNAMGEYAINVIATHPQGFGNLVQQRQNLETAEKHKIISTVKKDFGVKLQDIRKEAAKDLNNIYASPQKRIFNSGHGLMENVSIAAQVQELSDNEINKAARRFSTDHPDLYISGGQVSSGMGGASSASYSPVSAATTDAGKETQDIVNKGLNSQLNAIREMNQSAAKGTENALNSFSQSNSANLNKILSATILTNENINQNIKANFQKGNSITVQGFEGLNSQAIKLGSDLEDSIQDGNRRLAQTNEKSFQTLSDQLYQNELAAAEAHEAEMEELSKSKASFNQLVDLTSIQQTSVEHLAVSLKEMKAQGAGWTKWAENISNKLKEWDHKFTDEIASFIGKYLGIAILGGAVAIKGIEALEDYIPAALNGVARRTSRKFNKLSRGIAKRLKIKPLTLPEQDEYFSNLGVHPMADRLKGILEKICGGLGLPDIQTLIPGASDLMEPLSNLVPQFAKDLTWDGDDETDFSFSSISREGKTAEGEFASKGKFDVKFNLMSKRKLLGVNLVKKTTKLDELQDMLSDEDRTRQFYGNISKAERKNLKSVSKLMNHIALTGPISLDDVIQALQSVVSDFLAKERKNNPNLSDSEILKDAGHRFSEDLVNNIIDMLSNQDSRYASYLKEHGEHYKGLIAQLLSKYLDRKEIFQDVLIGLDSLQQNEPEEEPVLEADDAVIEKPSEEPKAELKTTSAPAARQNTPAAKDNKKSSNATADTNKRIKKKSFNTWNLTSEQIKEIEGQLQVQMDTNSEGTREHEDAKQRLEAFRAFVNGGGKFSDGSFTETRPKQQPNVTVNQTNVVQKVTYPGLKQGKP